MKKTTSIHPDFQHLLDFKSKELIALFADIRNYILEVCPGSYELLYHTHALTTVFGLSEKLADAFCTVPIYTNHLNLGFNKGTLLKDPHKLLTGSGNLMRHIDIKHPSDYRNAKVKALIIEAYKLAEKDMEKKFDGKGSVVSKIKITK